MTITQNQKTYNATASSIERAKIKLIDNTRPVLYCSGPMSGIAECNFPKFYEAAEHFRNLGYFVLNPAEHFNGVTSLSYEVYFLEDVIELLFCTHIYMMEGWEKSRGAYCEYLLARRLNLIFVDKTGLRIDPPDVPEVPVIMHMVDSNERLLPSDQETLNLMDQIYKLSMQTNVPPTVDSLDELKNNSFTNHPASIEAVKAATRQRDKAEDQVKALQAEVVKLKEELKIATTPVTELKSTKTVLEEAQGLVLGDRRNDYNHPYYNFKQTAELWTALGFNYKNKSVEPENVAEAMVLVKMSRESFKHKVDNLVDEAGYILCHSLVLEKKEEIEKDKITNSEASEDEDTFSQQDIEDYESLT